MPNEEDVMEEEKEMYKAIQAAAKVMGEFPQSLDAIAKLDTCVTVIDCKAFQGDVTTCDSLLERYREQVSNLFYFDQIEI